MGDLLSEIRASVEERRRRQAKAKETAGSIPKFARLFLSLRGVEFSFATLGFVKEGLVFRNISTPPDPIEFTRVSGSPSLDLLSASAYSETYSAEIGFDAEFSDQDLDAAYFVARLLRLKSNTDYLIPAISDTSWDTFYSSRDCSATVALVEQPRFFNSPQPKQEIGTCDVEWLIANAQRASRLQRLDVSKRFSLAFDLATNLRIESSSRERVATIWSALDALFGRREYGVAKSISKRIADWISDTSAEQIEDLYSSRSDVVHGRSVPFGRLNEIQHLCSFVLRQSLLRAIENEKPPLPDST